MESTEVWQRAILVLDDPHIDTVAVNEIIGHCKRAGNWQMAMALLAFMEDALLQMQR